MSSQKLTLLQKYYIHVAEPNIFLESFVGVETMAYRDSSTNFHSNSSCVVFSVKCQVPSYYGKENSNFGILTDNKEEEAQSSKICIQAFSLDEKGLKLDCGSFNQPERGNPSSPQILMSSYNQQCILVVAGDGALHLLADFKALKIE